MRCQDSLQLLPGEFPTASHIKALEQLSNLQIKGLLALLLVEFGDLALNFFHNLDLTLKKFSE